MSYAKFFSRRLIPLRLHSVQNSSITCRRPMADCGIWIAVFSTMRISMPSNCSIFRWNSLKVVRCLPRITGGSIHSDLASWLEAIAYLRNIIAHHSRLWSRNMVKRPSEPLNPQHPWLSRQLSDTEAKRPFYIVTAMLYLCDAVDSKNTLREDVYNLLKKHKHLPIERMEFFDGWEQEAIWASKR